jgi:hypothetical protein
VKTAEAFPLSVVGSLSTGKKRTGETLKIYASGNQFEISGMMHGQADALVRGGRGTERSGRAVGKTGI